jgi:subtilase family protein/GEVED domain-containing protein/type IX secretion system substrate protein
LSLKEQYQSFFLLNFTAVSVLTILLRKTSMIKLLKILSLYFFLFLLPAIGFAQRLDHIQGEILIQLKNQSLTAFNNSIHHLYPELPKSIEIKSISTSFNIWKISFDHNTVNEINLLAKLNTDPNIENAQFNFFTENRTEPNDTYFSGLWHLNNTGQNGGTPGVDLDATLAWDQATGGVSYTGDTIVICIIDESFDFNHEDLLDNIWINYDEIPDDSIDNDNNGFVDDYWGWNAETLDDDIQNSGTTDWHGTGVSGIAGAIGNNSTGITGLVWNIKLMLVGRGNTFEHAVIAYDYPFKNRKLYNQTLGQKGAFVVATNSSWGVDFGTPAEAPLWCAMYDSLGSVGVLNAAATINANVDVDVVGDLPTTCLSQYLITTTSVNNYDVKTVNAGYGAESIDLGAFGKNILTTSNNNNYALINGTSAAAPQIAATIGLLHSAPCPSFAVFAKNNPQQAALQLKNYILDGSEANTSLEGITVSGGRLNTNNSLNLLMDDCDFSGCFAPYLVEINDINSSNATIEWLSDIATDYVNLRYRKVNTMTWTTINNIQSPMVLNGLLPCTFYEFQLRSICGTSSSSYTASFTFKTDGCCNAPNDLSIEAFDNSLFVSWNEITAAVAYNIRYRESGTSTWDNLSVSDNNIILDNLINCQEYEIQISTICANTQSLYSASYFSSSLGCGACLDFDYCNSFGPPISLTWISGVSIADLTHYSGPSTIGYSDFTDNSANLIQGFIHEIEIYTDFNFIQFPAYFSVWIDLNQNGEFSEEEELLHSSSPSDFANGILFIPPTTLLGSTRMRVAFLDEDLGSCGIYETVGEVEDYCVYISEPTECLPPVNFNFTSTENSAHLTWSGNLLINEYMLSYRELGTSEWNFENIVSNNFTITNLSPCTDYEFFMTSICVGETSSPSPTYLFTTKGCGACLDYQYCDNTPCLVNFEWIQSVSFNDFDNNSGSNSGYMHFPDFSTDVIPGETYDIALEAGFSNDYFDEQFYVWIDFDQNGILDESEKVLEKTSQNGEIIYETVEIPTNALTGSTRMRVAMKYADPIYDACESGFYGEIEEYCINIGDVGCLAPESLYFNFVDTSAISVYWQPIIDAVSYKVRYRLSGNSSLPWKYITTSNDNILINSLIHCEDYDIQIQTICANGISDFNSIEVFNTCNLVSTITQVTPSELKFYPNPFSKRTTLSFDCEQPGVLNVQVFSSFGNLVKIISFNTSIGNNTFQIDLENSAPGLYFVKSYFNNQSIATQKIINQTP